MEESEVGPNTYYNMYILYSISVLIYIRFVVRFGYFTAKTDYFGGFKARFNLIEKHPHTNVCNSFIPSIRIYLPSTSLSTSFNLSMINAHLN